MYWWIWLVNCKAFSELKWRLKCYQLHSNWSSTLGLHGTSLVGYKEVTVSLRFTASRLWHTHYMAHTLCDIIVGNFSTIEVTATVHTDMSLLRTWYTFIHSPMLHEDSSFYKKTAEVETRTETVLSTQCHMHHNNHATHWLTPTPKEHPCCFLLSAYPWWYGVELQASPHEG